MKIRSNENLMTITVTSQITDRITSSSSRKNFKMQKLHSYKMSPNNNNNTAIATTFPSLKGETTPDVNASVTTKTTTTTRLNTASVLPNRMTTTRCKNNRSKSNKNQFSRTTATPSTATTTTATTTKTTATTTTTKDANRCNGFHTAFNDTFRQRLLLVVATVFLLLANDGHFGSSTKLVVHAEEFELANTTTLNVTAATATTTEEAFWQNGTKSQTRLTEIGQQEINNSSTSWSSLTSSTSATTISTTTKTPTLTTTKASATPSPATPPFEPSASWRQLNFSQPSFFSQYAKRSSSGNELWDGIIRDCYQRPSFSCFQKNVYAYLSDALEANDVNVTQRLKFFRNDVDYEEATERMPSVTEAAVSQDDDDNRRSSEDGDVTGDGVGHAGEEQMENEHLLKNEIPQESRGAPSSTPIEEVTNALYGKSVKFAMTHDIELRLPEVLFDGATFRISPRHFEGDGVIAKLELIPKQALEARLAGKILMKKIHKFLKSKLLLSFLALLLIVKIIKIKLFWLLPVVIGVGAAKKLLLKFLLFLFPALSHLFKLCSYYQQTYHSTKYHHHHHLINHHHTVSEEVKPQKQQKKNKTKQKTKKENKTNPKIIDGKAEKIQK